MAGLIQNLAVVKIDSAAGTLTDYSDTISTCQVTQTAGTGAYNTFASAWQEKPADGTGPMKASITITGPVDLTAGSAYDRLLALHGTGGLVTFEGYTPDETAGSIKYTGEIGFASGTAITIMATDSSAGGVQTFSVTLESSGAMTQSVVAS